MSSLGQGWKVNASASMIVPTGSAFFATSTFGPIGTGAAAACCAPAPVNMFLAMTAVTTAMTSAPTSSASFFTSMARSPPPCGPLEQAHTSDKLVKKPLGENRETTECDRDSVRNFRSPLAPFGPVPDENAQGEHAAGNGHQHEEPNREQRRKPQRERRGELDVTAAHHSRVKGTSEQRENHCPGGKLDGHAGPRRQRHGQPIDGRGQRYGQVESVGNRERAHVDDCRNHENCGEREKQQIGKCAVEHDE